MSSTCARWRRWFPTLSEPVGGTVSCVLGLDAVVLGDGGVSSGAVGRYVSVGDASVPWSRVVLSLCCRVQSVAVCVTLTGCQEVVTRMCVV